MSRDLTFRDLTTDADILSAFDVTAELRPHLVREEFVHRVRAQAGHGYQLSAGLTEGGRVVVVAGWRITATLMRGDHLFVDDLVTAAADQGKGHGRAMLRWLAGRAAERGLTRVYLDSRATAKGFYERVGFTMHTSIPCWAEVEALLRA